MLQFKSHLLRLSDEDSGVDSSGGSSASRYSPTTTYELITIPASKFPKPPTLPAHLKSLEPEATKPYRGRSSIVKVNQDDITARRHMLKKVYFGNHDILKTWICGLCQKEFKYRYNLVRHVPVHTDVRSYVCDLCGRAFRQLSTLKQHKLTHLNLRPHVCDVCHKTFNRSSSMLTHRRIHTEPKKFVCTACGKGFHQKGNLKNHAYIHTNAKPFRCGLCDRGFNQQSNLTVHLNTTHFREHICSYCKRCFGSDRQLMNHLEKVHPSLARSSSLEILAAVKPLAPAPAPGSEPPSSSFSRETKNFAAPLPDPVYIGRNPPQQMLNCFRENIVPFVLYYSYKTELPTIYKAVSLGGENYAVVATKIEDFRGSSEINFTLYIREVLIKGRKELYVEPVAQEFEAFQNTDPATTNIKETNENNQKTENFEYSNIIRSPGNHLKNTRCPLGTLNFNEEPTPNIPGVKVELIDSEYSNYLEEWDSTICFNPILTSASYQHSVISDEIINLDFSDEVIIIDENDDLYNILGNTID